jgi:hypothetical protein
MLEMQTALRETQWRGMKRCLEKIDKKRDAYHKDDILCGKGITAMVKRVVAATEWDQREGRMADTEGVSIEASIHADVRQTGRPKMLEEPQQLQSGRQRKSVPMPKPKLNLNPNSKPNLAASSETDPETGTRAEGRIDTERGDGSGADTDQMMGAGLTTKPKEAGQPSSRPDHRPAPTTSSSISNRHLILWRDESVPLRNKMDQEIA